MALTPLPDPPQTADPANFATKADALVAALATMVSEINAGGVPLTGGTVSTLTVTGATTLAAVTASGLITANAGATIPVGQTLTVRGVSDLAAGTAALPSIIFGGTTDAGFYNVEAEVPGVATSGLARARWTAAGFFKANDIVADLFSATGTYHELGNSLNADALRIRSKNASFTSSTLLLYADKAAGTDFQLITGQSGSGTVFNVRGDGNVTNTNNSYGAISDRKMKADEVLAGSQWEDVKALASVMKKYSLKADPEKRVHLGLVAQDVELVSPGLVDETDDYEMVDGERKLTGTKTKSVKYSIAHMKALKALGEVMERVEALEAR